MTTTSAMYSGKKERLTFEKLDDMVISWGGEKYEVMEVRKILDQEVADRTKAC
jgi:hypothetical protein